MELQGEKHKTRQLYHMKAVLLHNIEKLEGERGAHIRERI
jgi:hypothetical protein